MPNQQVPDTQALIDDIDAATERLLGTVDRLDDPAVLASTALPGWTRGHVLSHLARNADGLGNLLFSASNGETVPMYPSRQARNADIEAGSRRDAAAQRADLRASALRLRTEALALPAQAWRAQVEPFRGRPLAAWGVLMIRLCELELHHVDLAAGYGCDDWSTDFVALALDQTVLRRSESAAGDGFVATLQDTDTGARWRLAGSGPAVAGPGRALLGWLTGRGPGDRLTVTPAGPLPQPPPWP